MLPYYAFSNCTVWLSYLANIRAHGYSLKSEESPFESLRSPRGLVFEPTVVSEERGDRRSFAYACLSV